MIRPAFAVLREVFLLSRLELLLGRHPATKRNRQCHRVGCRACSLYSGSEVICLSFSHCSFGARVLMSRVDTLAQGLMVSSLSGFDSGRVARSISSISDGRFAGEASQFKFEISWSALFARSLVWFRLLICLSNESSDLRTSSSSSLMRRISSAKTIGLSGMSLSGGVNSAIFELIAVGVVVSSVRPVAAKAGTSATTQQSMNKILMKARGNSR